MCCPSLIQKYGFHPDYSADYKIALDPAYPIIMSCQINEIMPIIGSILCTLEIYATHD